MTSKSRKISVKKCNSSSSARIELRGTTIQGNNGNSDSGGELRGVGQLEWTDKCILERKFSFH